MTRPTDEVPRPEERPKTNPASEMRGWYSIAGVGFEFIAAVILFGGLGWFLDGRLNTSPWLLLIGCGLGFAVGLYLMVRAGSRSFRR